MRAYVNTFVKCALIAGDIIDWRYIAGVISSVHRAIALEL